MGAKRKLLLFKGFSWIPILLITVASAIVIFGSAYVYLYFSRQGRVSLSIKPDQSPAGISKPTATPAPTPTPLPYNLPSGTQIYRFSYGSEVKGPKPSSVTIDPLDPKNGTTQTITIDLESESPITKASVVIITDNKEKNIDLKLIEGDANKGQYQGSWQVNDTYDTKYAIRYDLRSETATYDETMFIR